MAEIYETPGTSGVNRSFTNGVIHWPSVIAGAFVTLALLVVAAVLGAALSLDTFRTSSSGRGHEVGAAIWGIITALVCFGIGGWVAARNAYALGRGSPTLNGILVWAVVVPLMAYGVGAIGSSMATHAINNAPGDNATPASARMDSTGAITNPGSTAATDQNVTSHARSAAWWTLFSLVLGFAGAAGMSSMVDDRFGRRTTGPTTTHPHS